MFLEARENLDSGATSVISFTAEQISVTEKTPHTEWPSSSVVPEPFTRRIPSSFLSLENSRKEAQAVLSSVQGMTATQMNVHSEKIAAFLSAASLISSVGEPKNLLFTVDLRCFSPLGDVEEEEDDDEDEETKSG